LFFWLKNIPADFCVLNISMETNITVTDLIAIRDILNLAAERGAFKAEEMLDVGTVYTKLTKFLEAVVAQAAAQEQQTAEADQPTGE
jgi:hypothetical protein